MLPSIIEDYRCIHYECYCFLYIPHPHCDNRLSTWSLSADLFDDPIEHGKKKYCVQRCQIFTNMYCIVCRLLIGNF
jgi:hypothetical protein